MAFEWNQSLSVGVDVIDQQHQELIKRINSLRDAMSQGKGRGEVAKTVDFLADYVVEHFDTEERYMARFDYAAAMHHKAEHRAFMEDFGKLKKQYDALESQGAITSFVTIDIQRRLVDWLINHIGKVDKSLGAFLSGRV